MFESDYDDTCDLIYKAYEERWMIETVFRYYKDVNEFDETRVHGDYSVISSEFVCFISTVIISRLLKKFEETGALEDMSYGKAMKMLERAKKVRIDDKWQVIRLIVKDAEAITKLGLLPKLIIPKNSRGRSRKKAL